MNEPTAKESIFQITRTMFIGIVVGVLGTLLIDVARDACVDRNSSHIATLNQNIMILWEKMERSNQQEPQENEAQ